MKGDAFDLAVKSDEPGDVTEEGLKTAAAMFAAIGDSEAAERARQCTAACGTGPAKSGLPERGRNTDKRVAAFRRS